MHTVYIVSLCGPGQDLPQSTVFDRVPIRLSSQQVSRHVSSDAAGLTGGGSMKSPRGNGSRMKTVYWISEVGASGAMVIAQCSCLRQRLMGSLTSDSFEMQSW
jgi:hypothetical protein